MSNKGENLPFEIYEAFSKKDTGYSLLIKGNAGVGKSTFALTLLGVFEDTEPIYISTRVAPTSLFAQFPWMKNKLKEENIIDATRTFIPPIGSSKELKTHVQRTIRFNDVNEFLKIVYEKAEKYANPIIVIDSWDAILGAASLNQVQEWETVLTEFVRQMDVKLILVSETKEKTYLDYIVDGIVTLFDAETENRTLREIEINKIRGVERKQKRYNYTLHNNIFRYCSSFGSFDSENQEREISSKPWEVVDAKSENFYSTGSSEIDELYRGGLKTSTLNLWEIDSDVPLSAFSDIMIPMICNFISQKLGAIIYSIDGVNSRFVDKNDLFIQLNTKQISKRVRYMVENIAHVSVKSESENRPYVVPFSMSEYMKAFSEIYKELVAKTNYKPILSVTSYDFLSFMRNDSDLSNEVYNHLKFVRNYNLIEIGILNQIKKIGINKPGQRSIDKYSIEDISYFFDTHMKMILKNNAIFIYGIKPYTCIYWLKFIFEGNELLPKIKLIPMV